MRGFKNDTEARAAWGAAYDSIPKSVFALAAWHLANLCSDPENGVHATQRFAEEVEALAANGFLTEAQLKNALKALAGAA